MVVRNFKLHPDVAKVSVREGLSEEDNRVLFVSMLERTQWLSFCHSPVDIFESAREGVYGSEQKYAGVSTKIDRRMTIASGSSINHTWDSRRMQNGSLLTQILLLWVWRKGRQWELQGLWPSWCSCVIFALPERGIAIKVTFGMQMLRRRNGFSWEPTWLCASFCADCWCLVVHV